MTIGRGLLLTGVVAAAHMLVSCGGAEDSTREEAANVQANTVVAPVDANAAVETAVTDAMANQVANEADPEPAADEKEVANNAASAATPPPPVKEKAPTVVAAAAPPASFAQCAVCHTHTKDGKAKMGPNLFGVAGATAGTRPAFNYSKALADSGLKWTGDNLNRFLEDPRGTVPGTKMIYPGMKDAAKRQEVVRFLEALR